MIPKLPDFYVYDIIKHALEEDINYIDVTSDLLFDNKTKSHACMVVKENGVISGIDVAAHVFTTLDAKVRFNAQVNDGQVVKKGDVIAKIEGGTAAMLKAERTALNILQHMSGIATYTRLCVKAVEGTYVSITDTRKTLPGLRGLQKYAVLCGGGSNHRLNLSSAAMIKDNHIDACGSITETVKTLRKRAGHMVMIEVEVRDLGQLQEAIEAGADVIMLDNMDIDTMNQAVRISLGSAKRPKLESSGNVTLENIREIAMTGVDIISIGALTHSVKALDISMVWVSDK